MFDVLLLYLLSVQRCGYPDVQAAFTGGAVRLREDGAPERRGRDRVPPRKSHLQGESVSQHVLLILSVGRVRRILTAAVQLKKYFTNPR